MTVGAAAGCDGTPSGGERRAAAGALAALGGRSEISEGADGFLEARGSREWRFPRDHGAHPEYATEWWYTTGILRTDRGRRFGFELTFFRRGLVPPAESQSVAEARRDTTEDAAAASGSEVPAGTSPWRARDLILAHAAVTDVTGERFVTRDRLERAAHGWAGADTARLDVWIDEWRMRDDGSAVQLRVPPASTNGKLGLDLTLSTSRPPVLHGTRGLSPKAAGRDPHASWYASLPRLDTAGAVTVSGETFRVSGQTWLDHEFFSGGLARGHVGWDWFSTRLIDGRDLMLFRLRDASDATQYAAGTVTAPDGISSRALDTRGAVFEPLARWRSAQTGAEYPVAWRVRLPAEDLELLTRTPLAAQELVASAAGGFAYWEGLVDVSGSWRRAPVEGEGYVEMTGYDAPIELR